MVGAAGQIVAESGRQVESAANTMIQANARQSGIVAQSASNALSSAAINLQYDPKNGWALAKEGQAVGQQFVDTNMARFDTQQQQIRDALPDEMSKKVFDQHSQALQLHYQGQLLTHQAQETAKFNNTTEDATLSQFVQQATLQPNDPVSFQQNIDNIASYIDNTVAPRRGLSPETVTALKQHYLAAAVGARVTALADGLPGVADANPKAAAAILNEYSNQIGTPAANMIWKSIQHNVQTFQAAQAGQQAWTDSLKTLTPPALPANKGSTEIAPYTPQQIAERAKFVNSPTPWDSEINAASAATGVPASEIKLKIAMESGGNPNAVNKATGALGLGQFMYATAKQYGVTDREDPVQSIWGIAKMLKANMGANGDMSPADRAYYGGNPNAKGPNTDQYVENSRAVRQALNGGGGKTEVSSTDIEGLMGTALQKADERAEADAPGNPVVRDQYRAEVQKNWSKALTVAKGKEIQDFDTALGAIRQGGAQSSDDLRTSDPNSYRIYASLPEEKQKALDRVMDSNGRIARGENERSDPKLYKDMERRIAAEQVTDLRTVQDAVGHGISTPDYFRLKKLLNDVQNPDTNQFIKQSNTVKQTADKMLVSNMSALAVQNPDLMQEAGYRFGQDFDRQVKALRDAGQDPKQLLDPNSKLYALNPARVRSFMPTPEQVTAMNNQQAAAALAENKMPGAKPTAAPVSVKTPAD